MALDQECLVRLTSARTEMEGGIIVGGLQDRGIMAVMSGVYTANFRAEAPGRVEILIAEKDLPRAEAVLRDLHRELKEIDWSQVDFGDAEADVDESAELETTSSWGGWQRVCYAIVVAYLAWVAIQSVISVLRMPRF